MRAASIDRNLGPAGQFHDTPRVPLGVSERNVAGDGDDAEHVEFVWRGQGQKDRHRVVLAGIGIDDDAALHGYWWPLIECG